MKESDICYNLNSIQLSKEEKIFYLNRLAGSYRINENFREARKKYLEIFFIDPANFNALINYFRLFLGKRFVSETTKLYKRFEK